MFKTSEGEEKFLKQLKLSATNVEKYVSNEI